MAYSAPVMTLIFNKPRREKVRKPISFVAAKTCSSGSSHLVTCGVAGCTAERARPCIQTLGASRHIPCAMLTSPKLA
jgi:hypothetical protein